MQFLFLDILLWRSFSTNPFQIIWRGRGRCELTAWGSFLTKADPESVFYEADKQKWNLEAYLNHSTQVWCLSPHKDLQMQNYYMKTYENITRLLWAFFSTILCFCTVTLIKDSVTIILIWGRISLLCYSVCSN